MSYLFGLGLVGGLALFGTVVCGALRLRDGVPLRRAALEAAFVGYLLALVAVVALPFGRVDAFDGQYLGPSINLVPFATILGLAREFPNQVIRQIAGNAAMFAPLGFLSPVIFTRLRGLSALVLVALALSLGIEFVQLALRLMSLSQRSFDVDDVMLNVLGALIGYGFWRVTRRLVAVDGTIAAVEDE